MVYVAIDNGVTGTIGVISENFSDFIEVPVKKEQNYVKKKDIITRISTQELKLYLLGVKERTACEFSRFMAILERPMVNPARFKASCSALRALEAELGVIESLEIPHMYVDSGQWQRVMLPKGTKGEDLKRASRDIGERLFPQFAYLIKKHKDADGILMAKWAQQFGV